MKSMGVLPSNVDNVHASYNILPKDHSYIDFLAPVRKSAFSPYTSAKQAAGTKVPKDSPKKTKLRCCPIADEEDDDDYEAYMLRMEREADHQKESLANYKQVIGPDQSSMEMMPRSSKRVSWSNDEDNKDYDQLVAKQVIDTKTKLKTSTTFKGAHYSSSSELAKQVIKPKTKMSKTSSKRRSHSPTDDDIEPKPKKVKLISNGSHYPTMDDKVGKPKPKTKNKATSSKRSRSPVNDDDDDDDDEDYELAKKTVGSETKKNSASSSSSKRSHSSTTEDECDGENDKEMVKLKRKKQKDIVKELESKPPITNEVTKRLKEFITSDAINGTHLTLVIQKLLFTSDLRRGQNRLAMPINQLKTLEFLTPDEIEKLDNRSSLDVQLVGPKLEIYKEPMNLVKWNMQTTQSYVFKTHWSEFVADHVEDLVENSIIQVWSFRKHNKLCFALAKVGRAMIFDNQDDSPSSS